jgi:hypothetical protein
LLAMIHGFICAVSALLLRKIHESQQLSGLAHSVSSLRLRWRMLELTMADEQAHKVASTNQPMLC